MKKSTVTVGRDLPKFTKMVNGRTKDFIIDLFHYPMLKFQGAV